MIPLFILISIFEKLSVLVKPLLLSLFLLRKKSPNARTLIIPLTFLTCFSLSFARAFVLEDTIHTTPMISFLSTPLFLYLSVYLIEDYRVKLSMKLIYPLFVILLIAGISSLSLNITALQNVNVLAYIWLSLSYYMLLLKFQPRHKQSLKANLFFLILMFSGLLIFKSRIFLVACLVRLAWNYFDRLGFVVSKYGPSFLFIFAISVYLLVAPSAIYVTTALRSFKLEPNTTGAIETYADSFRLIGAPLYVSEMIGNSAPTLLLGKGFSKIPSLNEKGFEYDQTNNDFAITNSGDSSVDRLHNAYLTILFQTGYIGFFLFIGLIICMLQYTYIQGTPLLSEFICLSCISALFAPSIFFGCQQIFIITIVLLKCNRNIAFSTQAP